MNYDRRDMARSLQAGLWACYRSECRKWQFFRAILGDPFEHIGPNKDSGPDVRYYDDRSS